MSEKIFYVYEHWRPDTGVCFYVGKGKGKRAWDLKNMRNPYFKSVVSKLTSLGFAVDVRIVAKDLLEQEALDKEIALIAHYGVENLTNMTLGGDGMKNPTVELRAKISVSQKKRYQRPEELEKASKRSKGRVTSEETKRKLRITNLGRKHSDKTKKLMSKIAKTRGVSEICRAAQKLAVTGKKRAPFSQETIERMRAAATERERKKREHRAA